VRCHRCDVDPEFEREQAVRDTVTLVVQHMRSEAARFRKRDEGADAAVAAHLEIAADHIESGKVIS
jgi:hypothetical protein